MKTGWYRSAGRVSGAALLAMAFVMGAPSPQCFAKTPVNLLTNPSFEEGVTDAGAPVGWSVYGGMGPQRRLVIVDAPEHGGKALLIDDSNPGAELGLYQTVAAKPGVPYLATVAVKAAGEASPGGSYAQLRFLPTDELAQVPLRPGFGGAFNEMQVGRVAPPGTTHVRLYLYTHASPTPQVIVDDVRLSAVGELPAGVSSPGTAVVPEIAALKDLHLTTRLVEDGRATVALVAPVSKVYDGQAEAILGAIKDLTGVRPPLIRDNAPEAAIPLTGNVILLGNRSTNALIGKLYEKYYTLLDLKYPGPEGHVVRTLHNPFGKGHNAVFVGGSDLKGVERATDVFIAKLREAGQAASGGLAIGRLMEIQLGQGVDVPNDLRVFEIWEGSAGYGASGYFGWNSISKRMAMYYMTGDEFHAREALRLAFPDDQAKQEISDIDGERIENKDDPLGGPYHYNAHMMILFWDLVEESPVFTDEDRLRVTQAFARQLNHHGIRNAYVGPYAPTPAHVGSRHGQWTAISLYCLGRYFAKDYDHPVWPVCEDNGQLHFKSLHAHAWVSGENDNLYWYSTAVAPIFTYMALTGDRVPLENGVLATLLRGQETLASGRQPDWALTYASLGFLHKAAHITQDGRWLGYRERTGVNTDVFRLGQSYWPDESLKPLLPVDLVNTWQVNPLPEPMWRWRNNGFPLDESYLFMSYRSAADASGDFILLDGFNGASRNPYHTHAVLELRHDGLTILEGYLNQVLTRADGLVEKQIAMNAALKHHQVLGGTVSAIGEVPDAAYVNWQRALVHRVGKYTIFADRLQSRADADNLEVQILWQSKQGTWRADPDVDSRMFLDRVAGPSNLPSGWKTFRAQGSDYATRPGGPDDVIEVVGCLLLRAREVGAWLEMPFELEEAVQGEVFVDLLNYVDRGEVRIAMDGEVLVDSFQHYSANVENASVPLGNRALAAGTHRLRVEATGKHDTSGTCYVAIVGVTIKPDAAPEPRVPVVCTSRDVDTTLEGATATMTWVGPVREGDERFFFSVVTARPEGAGKVDCVQLGPNDAAVLLDEPMMVSWQTGEEASGQGLKVMAGDHLYCKDALAVGGLVTDASNPIEATWDFASGVMDVVVEEETVITLAVTSPQSLKLDGEPVPASVQEEGVTLTVPAGRHAITSANPSAGALDAYRIRNKAALEEGRQQRAKLRSETAQAPSLPSLPERASVSFDAPIADLKATPSDAGPLLCAVEGNTIHVLDLTGKEVRTLQADGPIRMVRWWNEQKLLLAGCADEKVIAFDAAGERKWVFVSEMDPAVFRAAKTYWFKSASGHEGIHGLHTGVFLDGKSQAFVGSACTLEILDENGALMKRMPQFWGKVATMRIIPGNDGSLDLLTARKYNGTHRVGMVNNVTLNPDVRRFNSVPAGHTFVGGWSSMNRHHLFFEDFDGDGVKELMSEINGTWNRVTVWDTGGTAKYDVSFGPGKRIPYKNIRDIDIADLDADGLPEIVVATSSGLIVALEGTCQKIWAKRLGSPLGVMNCVTPDGGPPSIIAACDDGQIVVLDREGTITHTAEVAGVPTCILPVTDADGKTLVAFGTKTGQVRMFEEGK
jgi:hypothetical protein